VVEEFTCAKGNKSNEDIEKSFKYVGGGVQDQKTAKTRNANTKNYAGGYVERRKAIACISHNESPLLPTFQIFFYFISFS
jgi:hypothetical protein